MHNKHRSISIVKQSSKINLFLVLHFLIGFILFIAYKFSWIAPTNLGKVILLYSFLLNFLFIFWLHKRLQNWLIYIQWLIVAIFQYAVYIILSQDADLIKGLSSVRGLLVFLILYQIFRQMSLHYANSELELRGRNSNMDNMVDFVGFYVIFMATIIAMLYPIS